MKILVIEDCAGRRSAACEFLQRRDYPVELVCDEGEASARAAQEVFDLIILDLMQPSASSLLLLHEIRQMHRDCKILILSTPAQIGERVTALIQGADDYLVKPFTAEELYASIRPLENLLQFDPSDNPGIELDIGEVRLAQLIARAIACLYGTATLKRVSMRPPRLQLPTVLADARWMEHMLLNLLNHALMQSPANAAISLEFHADGEVGELVIDSGLPLTPHSLCPAELLSGLQRKPGGCDTEALHSLALAKFCADSLGHDLQGCIMGDSRLQLRVSNIRIR